MSKTKWIVGLSIVGMMALSGTAFALTSESGDIKSVDQTLGFKQIVEITQKQENTIDFPVASQSTAQNSQLGTLQPTTATPSSLNNNSISTPGFNAYGGGYGMMGGQGINGYGGGYGMMGGGYDAKSLGVDLINGEVTTSDQAVAIAKAYIQKTNQDVVVAELHEFSNGYEVELKEGATGDKAYEVMVYRNGGQIITEMGPNIMWNTKYGHMNWGNNREVTVSEEQATNIAQEFISNMGQGYSILKPELAPGYYEFMIQKDGKDYSELDVNGYTGQVWFKDWQGSIIKTIEAK